jgi:hypothetical protein
LAGRNLTAARLFRIFFEQSAIKEIMMQPMTALEARAALTALAGRCTPRNSSVAFRAHLAKIEAAFVAGHLAEAAALIDEGAANHADRARIAEVRRNFHGEQMAEMPFQSSERITRAYETLSDMRFRFGYLTLGRKGSNVTIISGVTKSS